MSELKAFDVIINEDYKTKCYMKADADKVIAELKDKLKVQTSNAEEGWKEYRIYHTSYAEAVKELYEKNKQLRHHKYKRCLAMAKACEETSKRMYCEASTLKTINEIFGKEPKDAAVKKFELWGAIADTHRKRWLKIAEQFKEVK